MSYEPLHQKYRPQTFADLVGQSAIADTLSNASELPQPTYLAVREEREKPLLREFSLSLSTVPIARIPPLNPVVNVRFVVPLVIALHSILSKSTLRVIRVLIIFEKLLSDRALRRFNADIKSTSLMNV